MKLVAVAILHIADLKGSVGNPLWSILPIFNVKEKNATPKPIELMRSSLAANSKTAAFKVL